MSNSLISELITLNKNNSNNIIPDGYTPQLDKIFKPVYCTEKSISKNDAINGFVYFTTDTKKIYLGHNGEYLSMGGNSGIYYTNKEFEIDEITNEPDVPLVLTLSLEDFERGQLPQPYDLIINTSLGLSYLYQTKSMDPIKNTVEAYRIIVQGAGGGGGNGPAGGYGQGIITRTTPYDVTISKNSDLLIEFDLVVKDSSGEEVKGTYNAYWSIDGGTTSSTFKVNTGSNIKDAGSFLKNIDLGAGNYALKLVIDLGDDYFPATKDWSITIVDLYLAWDYKISTINYTDSNFVITWTPFGPGYNKNLYIVIDGNYDDQKVVTNITTSGSPINTSLPPLSHGRHTVELRLSTIIDDTPYSSVPVAHEMIFVDKNNNEIPVIVSNFNTISTQQYNTLVIPFSVYDGYQNPTMVDFYADGELVKSEEYTRGTIHEWLYTVSTSGSLELKISCRNVEESAIIFNLAVEPLDLKIYEADGYRFKLAANDFSGNDILKKWSYKDPINQQQIPLEFSENFDWVNGGLKSETVLLGQDSNGEDIVANRKFILIKAGTYLDIGYNLFNTNAKDYGKSIKIIFKTTNCYDYDAEFLTCFKNNVGLKMKAQEAIFKNSGASISTQYCENTYIDYTLDISPSTDNSTAVIDGKEYDCGKRYLRTWLDGVPDRVVVNTLNNSSQCGVQPIRIGSNDCDVYIYLIRIYEQSLTDKQHVDHFILDAFAPEEMLARFERNDVLRDDNDIDYLKLAEKNPYCRVHVYETGEEGWPQKAKHEVQTTYKQFYGSKTPFLTADNVIIKPQGTSSMDYGLSAYNIDSKFKNGFTDISGNHLDKWSMSEKSIPVNYFNTKVNVASCEGANNALNAEWYNRYQPYYDGNRRKKLNARDTMEFTPGVLFVKDNNKTTNDSDYFKNNLFANTSGYVRSPYPKLYAICNMGNSKKNTDIFHDTENENCFCIEVANNQTDEQFMVSDQFTDEFTNLEGTSELFEFRYIKEYEDDPIKTAEIRKKGVQAWRRLVSWMARSNPTAYNDRRILTAEEVTLTSDTYYTNEYYIYNANEDVYEISIKPFDLNEHYYNILPVEGESGGVKVKFGAYTFKGYYPPGFENDNGPNGEYTPVLKGFTDNTYAGVYDHDTKKYRMSKMLNECESYLIMDSIVYHYCFIERHTMVDNVAKNTFWSTEDGRCWNLVKNYDNDTADGINNSGYLTFSYGIEPEDKQSDAENAKNAFNAYQSVWFNFMHGLNKTVDKMFQDRDSKNAWDATNYLKLFEEFQNVIPERVWTADYYRKYIRPREIGKDTGIFLDKLDGGKRTHQRKQYETYQYTYMGSKHKAPSVTLTQLTLRANDPVGFNASTDERQALELPCKLYSDGYLYLSLGEVDRHVRQKRNRLFTVQMPVISPTDATFNIYASNIISYLGNLDKYYLSTYASQNGGGQKLRILQLGADENEDGTKYSNPNVETLSFADSTLLEEIYLQNMTHIDDSKIKPLNLIALNKLQILDISGSDFKSLTLAPNGIIHTVKLNALQELELNSLQHLELSSKNFDSCKNLLKLTIIDCAKVDSYDILCSAIGLKPDGTLQNSSDNLNEYKLTKINWVINNNSLYNNSELQSIDILNILKDKIAIDGTRKSSLTGQILIDQTCNANEYEIYSLYSQDDYYPNVSIKYTDKVNLRKAVHINIYQNDESEILLYSVLRNPDANATGTDEERQTIRFLTSAKGPVGIAMATPLKPSDAQNDYVFNENCKWHKYYNESLDGYYDILTQEQFYNDTPSEDVWYVPQHEAKPHMYIITLKDSDDTVIDFNVKELGYEQILNPPLYVYKPHSNPSMRYEFYGWITYTDWITGNPNPKIQDKSIIIKNNLTLYAYYKEELISIPNRYEYFFFETNKTKVIDGKTYTGAFIDIKEEYRQLLQGTLTLPLVTEDGEPVIGIVDNEAGDLRFLGQNQNINYLIIPEEQTYNEKLYESKYVYIGSRSCYCSSLLIPGLQKVSLSNSILEFGVECFRGQYNIIELNLPEELLIINQNALRGIIGDKSKYMHYELEALPPKIKYIGKEAFRYSSDSVKLRVLPETVSELGPHCFAECSNVAFSSFGSDTDFVNGLKIIPENILRNSGSDAKEITEITIKKSVSAIRANAFTQYLMIGTDKTSLERIYLSYPLNYYDLTSEYELWGNKNIDIDVNVRS